MSEPLVPNEPIYRYVHPDGTSEPVKVRRSAKQRVCDHCEVEIAKGELHAVAYRAFSWHVHLSCCRRMKTINHHRPTLADAQRAEMLFQRAADRLRAAMDRREPYDHLRDEFYELDEERAILYAAVNWD